MSSPTTAVASPLGTLNSVFFVSGLILTLFVREAVAQPAADLHVTSLRSFQDSSPSLKGPRKLTPEQRSYRLNEAGVKLILAGQREAGLNKLQRAVEIDPRNTTALYNIAGIYITDGQPERAVDVMERAVLILPNDISFLKRLAEAHFAASQIPDAISIYERIVEISPGHEQALLRLGTLYAMEKNWNKAEAALQKACAADPDNALAMTNLGNVLVVKEKYAEALEVLSRVQNKFPPSAENEVAMGIACEALGQKELALAHYSKARDLGSTDPSLGQHIARLRTAGIASSQIQQP